METIKNFFESSTVHGLNYISTTKKYVRLFWIIVVISGFTGAGVLIYFSFQDWNDNPIKTTIETLPISKITYPKVTVCPPKNTYTDLNYDLMKLENKTLNNDTRYELEHYAIELLQLDLYEHLMHRLNIIHEDRRYYNWYIGDTKIELPRSEKKGYDANAIFYPFESSAVSGTLSSRHYGEKYDVEKIDRDFYFKISIWPSFYVQYLRNKYKENIDLYLNIEKVSMQDLSSGYDTFFLDEYKKPETEYITKTSKNPSNKKVAISVKVRRKVSEEEASKFKLNLLPGFNMTWYYKVRGQTIKEYYRGNNITLNYNGRYYNDGRTYKM